MSDPFGIKASKRAAKAQEQGNELERQRQNLAAAKERRDLLRKARVSRADAKNNAAAQGVSTSSAAQGGLGSIESQFSSNLSFLDNYNLITDQASKRMSEYRYYQQKAQRTSALHKFFINTAITGATAVAGGG